MTNLKYLTKEALYQLYRIEQQSLNQIAQNYGMNRKVVRRLMDEFAIPLFTKSEIAKRQAPAQPSKDELVNALKDNSISTVAKKYGTTRGLVADWMKIYGLKSSYFKNDITKEFLVQRLDTMSPLQIAKECGVDLEVVRQRIRYYAIMIDNTSYSLVDTRERLQQIEINEWENQGFIKTLQYGDPKLYNSIIEHTVDHLLTTNKLTEKVFRLQTLMEPTDSVTCLGCKSPLPFYTMILGYGFNQNKDCLYCRRCYPQSQYFSGASRASQYLFDCIRMSLTSSSDVRYRNWNGELAVRVTEEHGGNKSYYLLDFICGHVNIEFDGVFWHKSRTVKDGIRDQYLASKGFHILRVTDEQWHNDPDQTLQRCLSFINMNTNVLAA